MKTKLSLALTVLFFSLSAFALMPNYVPGQYKIDPDHTRVDFVINHFVISEIEGRFNDVKGNFLLAKKFTLSTVEAEIATTSIDTAVAKRDEHLRSKDFFDVATYPKMTFVGKHFTGKPGSFTLVGDLTIKDVTKEVTFRGKYTGAVKDPMGNERVALNMGTKINRKDFHINYNDKIEIGPAVGDDVTIMIRTEGIKTGDVSK
jgi:polyisoprenoid-binding protein YceI